jgi:hypothetical protein
VEGKTIGATNTRHTIHIGVAATIDVFQNLCVLPKLFEKLIEPLLFKILNPILINEQHGFRQKKSTMTNLLRFYTNILESVEILAKLMPFI